jgi:fructose-bisphosphate aldolase class I
MSTRPSFRCAGKHDLATAHSLSAAIASAAAVDATDLVLDLSGVQFMDSTTIVVDNAAGNLEPLTQGQLRACRLIASLTHIKRAGTFCKASVNDWTGPDVNEQQLQKVKFGSGFIAALDQSGGSTPQALKLYGVSEDGYTGDDEMFTLMHEMRSRIVTSPSFNGDRILGAILFENTMDRQIEGRDAADYLWSVKQVVPFLKVDKGLTGEDDGVQVMKPIPGFDALLARATDKGLFGTKMRSVIKLANDAGVKSVVDQQFDLGRQILAAGLLPIIEPEIDIHSPQKAEAEALLKAAILEQLGQLGSDQCVMLKLTLPELDGFYADLVTHPRVVRVAALSGGYRREEANARLRHNPGVIASFSRALTEGLSVQQSDEDFDARLNDSIASIFEASIT